MQIDQHVKRSRSRMPPRGWLRSRRATSFQAPARGRFRRVLRFFINGWTISFGLAIVLAAFLVATYFWFQFSDRIDQKLLSGEVYTPSAGIYSAPKLLKVGEATSSLGLIEYLKSAGYIEKNNRADASRSRFSVVGESLLIEPGADRRSLTARKFFRQ